MNICRICNEDFEYSRSKGHQKFKCSSCFQKEKRLRIKKRCVEYKGGKCERCGYDKNLRALSFHHRNSKEKSFEISGFSTNSWESVKIELDKCDLLCANCHMEIESSLVH